MGTHKGNKKNWQSGDLVLRESDPKTHAMLMEVVEVKNNLARVRYLDTRAQAKAEARAGSQHDGWCAFESLQDPALFLKTEEFLQTLRERSQRSRLPYSF